MDPNTREPPPSRRFDLQIKNKEIMGFERSQSLRINKGRLSFQGDRIQSQPFGRKFIEEAPSNRTSQISKITVTLKCPEGWRDVTVRFDTTRWENNIPCNVLYYLQQTELNHYKWALEVGGVVIDIKGRAGRETDVLVLGLDFLERFKPWKEKDGRMEITFDNKKFLID